MEKRRKYNRVWPHSSQFNVFDIVGRRFGKLTVKKFLRKESYINRNKHIYACSCDCGNEIEMVRSNLTTLHSTSCGCLKKRVGNDNPCWGGHGEISGRFWGHIKAHAINRKLKFKITIEDAWNQFQKQNRQCALTGCNLSLAFFKEDGKYDFDKRTASLDRIDSKKGYEIDNIQWVHKEVNRVKGNFPNDKFIELCQSVAKHCGAT